MQIGTRLEITSVKRISRQMFFFSKRVKHINCLLVEKIVKQSRKGILTRSFLLMAKHRATHRTFVNKSAPSVYISSNLLIPCTWSPSESRFFYLSRKNTPLTFCFLYNTFPITPQLFFDFKLKNKSPAGW